MNFEDRVAVLGCGPAGLLAAHAVAQAGKEPVIYSVKRRSPIGGAQYLHKHIPGVTDPLPDGQLTYIKHGDAAGYADKVYGDPAAPTSWGSFEGEVSVWNLRRAYNRLWDMYAHRILDEELVTGDIDNLVEQFPMVLSCVPRPAFCFHHDIHIFELQEVWIHQNSDAEEDGENYIIYDGTTWVSWYRQSVIFGTRSTEWSHKPTHAGPVVMVRKPLRHNCDCHYHPDRIVYLGRYGAWHKPLLVTDAYEGAVDALHRL